MQSMRQMRWWRFPVYLFPCLSLYWGWDSLFFLKGGSLLARNNGLFRAKSIRQNPTSTHLHFSLFSVHVWCI